MSPYIVLLQQHPGAKEKNIDKQLAEKWFDAHGRKATAPRLFTSEISSDDSQVLADGLLYYQTSMGPQFVLAGIPTMQVGHEVYEDILVKNKLCTAVIKGSALSEALSELLSETKTGSNVSAIEQGLGLRSDWSKRLADSLKVSALARAAEQ